MLTSNVHEIHNEPLLSWKTCYFLLTIVLDPVQTMSMLSMVWATFRTVICITVQIFWRYVRLLHVLHKIILWLMYRHLYRCVLSCFILQYVDECWCFGLVVSTCAPLPFGHICFVVLVMRKGGESSWSGPWHLRCTLEVFRVHSYQDQFIQPGWAECVFLCAYLA